MQKRYEYYQKLVAPHLESFDFAIEEGLSLVVGEIPDQFLYRMQLSDIHHVKRHRPLPLLFILLK